jgi:hypothetical protein
LRERRVAHPDVLRFYLEHYANEGLSAFNDAEIAWERMTNAEELCAYLSSIEANRRESVISALGTFESEITEDRVLPGAVALLNTLPSLPDRRKGLFDFGPHVSVTRFVYRLLRSIENPIQLEEVVAQALPRIESAYSRLTLIEMIGHRDGVGHSLVSEQAEEYFHRSWRDYFRSLDVNNLLKERELLRSFLILKDESPDDEPEFAIPDDPRITRAVLDSARSDSRTQTLGSRKINVHPRLAWDSLVRVFGTEHRLSERIDGLRAIDSIDCREILELAARYQSGWRPNNH